MNIDEPKRYPPSSNLPTGLKGIQEIQERQAGKNAIVLDPDGYMIALFEPDFSDQKDKQTTGYVGFTPE